MLGTGPLLGHALYNAWDMPAFGTGSSKSFGQGRSWGMPFEILGTDPLVGHALQDVRDHGECHGWWNDDFLSVS